jgi:hypothetical protein
MKYISYLIIVLLAAGMVALAVAWHGEKRKAGELAGLLEQVASDSKGLHVIQDYRSVEILLNGKKLPAELALSDGKGNEIAWDSVLDGDKLALYFPEGSCDDCVNAALARVEARIDAIGRDRVVILINATSRRYVAQYKANARSSIPVFEARPRREGLFPVFAPCYLVIERATARVNSAYIPRRENPEGMDRYVEKVIEDYFQDHCPRSKRFQARLEGIQARLKRI